jgi:hypothetical protein
METTKFSSNIAVLNITVDLQLTICEGVENNSIISFIFQSIAAAFLSP